MAKRSARSVFAGVPNYAYDKRLHNYVDLSTGRMVSRSVIVDALRDFINSRDLVLENLSEMYANGILSREEFYVAFTNEVANSYKAAAALSQGGWHNLTPSHWGKVGRELRDEYQRIVNFIDDIDNGRYIDTDGNMQIAAIRNRAVAYNSSAYGMFWRLKDEEMMNDDAITEERWWAILDETTCERCARFHAMGWQPKGTFPPPPLHPSCRCGKSYR